MSARDKIILLSALVVIVGGALTINGRFNAENTVALADESTNIAPIASQRELAIKELDTYKDARAAADIINAPIRAVEKLQQQNAEIAAEELPEQEVVAVRAKVDLPKPQAAEIKPAVADAKPVKVTTGGSYVVKKGQTLTHIAIDVYNDKSNAIKNAKKIYELNKDILPSMDKVKEGQELRIPVLSDSADNGGSKLKQLADAFQDKVQMMSSSYSAAPKGKMYVVKKGDSLWKIAEKAMGNGYRYKEIVDANKGVLDSNKKLSPGMAIVIPN